ncbi:DUF4170 domain-containing protein [Oleispirillum naphthae]|uniref:DUF4170 domain-containing protein n=1 Tax=Oleispirillum naphthae TaxID=2838853 RepID=UPI00308268AF
MTAKTGKRCFYVVGGEYADTAFERPAPGAALDCRGPLTEAEAHALWRELTGKTVDNAMVRYVVEERDAADPAYVVGGEYADTGFARLAPGRALEVFGPFTPADALAQWRAKTASTVDSCLHRYDVVSVAELSAFTARVSA